MSHPFGFEAVNPLGDFDEKDVLATFERLGRYVAGFRHLPVRNDKWREGQIAELADGLPEKGISMEAVLDRFENLIAPGMLPWNNPGFMGFFGISAPLPTVAAATLTTIHNSNRMVRIANPAGPELDLVAGRWLGQLLNVPETMEAQLFSSASQSHMHAVGAAFNRRTGGRARREGLAAIGRNYRIYRSVNAHFFADKNAIVTGIGLENVVVIPATKSGAMDLDALEAAIIADLAENRVPLMVVATVGTTSTNAVDPVEAIADLCERHGIYLYVDAAFAGAFAALPEFDWVRAGWDRADAICVNPHKQLMVPLGCSALFLKARDELRQTYSVGGAYIPDHQNPDPMDYTALCGMPLNSLAPIFMLMAFGADGIRERLSNTVRLAKLFADLIDADPAFEILAPHPFTTICFRALPKGIHNPAVVDGFNAYVSNLTSTSARLYMSPTKLDGRIALRLTIGNIDTSEAHVLDAYGFIRAATEAAGRMLSFRLPSDGPLGNGASQGLWSRLPRSVIPAVEKLAA
jgi:aromatic-L-amino-acid/L-tryptophan decarboxylase